MTPEGSEMHDVDTVTDLLDHAARHGDRPAVTCEGRSVSFAALYQAARACAARLADWGVRPGDRVSLYSGNSLEWVTAYFSTLLAGAIVNPVNVLNTPDEVRYITEDCGASLLLVGGAEHTALAATAGLPELMTIDRPVNGLPSLQEPSGGAAAAASLPRPAPTDPSTITYTSGTTGRPKGAVLSHRAVARNAAGTAWMHARSATDRFATGLPLAHAYGAAVLNAALLVGGEIHITRRFEPQGFLDILASQRITVMDGVPTMYAYMLALETLDDADLSTLRCCLVGGQAMPPAIMAEVERRFGAPLVELWGMTEIAGLGSTHDVRGPHRHANIGRALPGMEIKVDASSAGEVGELMVRGPTVMEGYWGRPEATAEVLGSDGWLRTGDLGTEIGDGTFAIVDRKKDMILCGGYNVYPAEIERVLAEHADVAMVAVGRAEDPARGEVPIAYIVPRVGAPPNEAALLAHCRERLARYKLPRAIHFVEDMPKTSTGKIMRRALHEGSAN